MSRVCKFVKVLYAFWAIYMFTYFPAISATSSKCKKFWHKEKRSKIPLTLIPFPSLHSTNFIRKRQLTILRRGHNCHVLFSHTQKKILLPKYFLTSLPCFPEEPPKKKKNYFLLQLTEGEEAVLPRLKTDWRKRRREVWFSQLLVSRWKD